MRIKDVQKYGIREYYNKSAAMALFVYRANSQVKVYAIDTVNQKYGFINNSKAIEEALRLCNHTNLVKTYQDTKQAWAEAQKWTKMRTYLI